MIDKTLQRIVDQGLVSVPEISEVTGVALSTVYRWMAGKSEPSFHAMALLLRQLRNQDAQSQLVNAFLAGTRWQGYDTGGELDINADGTIDMLDALDSSIDSVNTASQTLQDVRNLSRDGKASPDDTAKLIDMLRHLVHQCTVTQQVLVKVSSVPGRKKAKVPQ